MSEECEQRKCVFWRDEKCNDPYEWLSDEDGGAICRFNLRAQLMPITESQTEEMEQYVSILHTENTALRAEVKRLKEQVYQIKPGECEWPADGYTWKEYADDAWGCLDMVKEMVEAKGIDMSATPPMMYPEAIHNLWAEPMRNGCKLWDFTETVIAAYQEAIATEAKLYEKLEAKYAELSEAVEWYQSIGYLVYFISECAGWEVTYHSGECKKCGATKEKCLGNFDTFTLALLAAHKEAHPRG